MSETISRDLMKEMTIEQLLGLTANEVEELRELATVRSFSGQFVIKTLSLVASSGEDKGHIAMQVSVSAVTELEETNPFSLPDPEEGAIHTERYYPGYGIQRLTKVMEACVPNGTSIEQFIQMGEGIEFAGILKAKSRKDKDTKEVKLFNELDVFSLVGPETPAE